MVDRVGYHNLMEQKPGDIFKNRQERFANLHDQYRRKYNLISWARVALFIASVSLIILLLTQGLSGTAFIVFLLCLPVFFLILKWHQHIDEKQYYYSMLTVINKEELKRLDHQFHDLDQGTDFLHEDHPYSYDLDIFGRNSLFQLLNRTGTSLGRKVLAQWLLSKAQKKEILERQSAIQQLTDELDFRQRLQASGRLSKENKDYLKPFLHWLHEPARYLHQWRFKVVALCVPFFSIGLIMLVSFGSIDYSYLILPILITGAISATILPYTSRMHQQTEQAIHNLRAYYGMIWQIERSNFNDPRLMHLRSALTAQGQVASIRIRVLRRILDFFNSRANMLYWIFNGFFLTDLLLVLYAEKWKERSDHLVETWFAVVAEFESLASLAAFSFAHPSYATPTIAPKLYELNTKSIGHPLIPGGERVCNDFSLQGKGNIAIITGSNMAGKSTFLRTIGINAVLAFSGASVCADAFDISEFNVYTSMRTKDNLEEHVSGFYAELIRIKNLIETIKDNQIPVLFLLDEILKGTNSMDRHRGSRALLKQLSSSRVMGFVSTHDLELGKMAAEGTAFKNFSFNSYVKDNKLKFDYRLKPGVCESFNASLLMAGMGIKIDPEPQQ